MEWLVRREPDGTTSLSTEAEAAPRLVEGGDRHAIVASDPPTDFLTSDFPLDPSGILPACAVAAHWDDQELVLIRDATGLRPLFYGTTPGGTVVAGTELRRVAPSVGATPSPTALAAWIAGAPLAPEETLLAGVRRVPAGQVAVVRERQVIVRPRVEPAPSSASFGTALERTAAAIVGGERSGVFLSGGVDSATIIAAVSRSATPPPLALCVDLTSASEAQVQHAVAKALRLTILERPVRASEQLVRRALRRAQTSLWPTPAPWAPIFDDLVDAAAERGVRVVLDGIGGDELLDAGYAAAPLIARRPWAIPEWLLAERRYTGSARAAVRAMFPRRARDAEPPDWVAPSLVESVRERLTPDRLTYWERLAADRLSSELAAQREETFDDGVRRGVRRRHPFWYPEVAGALQSLHPRESIRRGHPKSPARTYLQQAIPAIKGPWPQPKVADALADGLLASLQREIAKNGLPALEALGVIHPSAVANGVPNREIWRMLCTEYWVRGTQDWGEVA